MLRLVGRLMSYVSSELTRLRRTHFGSTICGAMFSRSPGLPTSSFVAGLQVLPLIYSLAWVNMARELRQEANPRLGWGP